VWGEPRLTQDTDIRVALGRDDADQLLRLLGSDYVALAVDPAASSAGKATRWTTPTPWTGCASSSRRSTTPRWWQPISACAERRRGRALPHDNGDMYGHQT